WTWGGKCRGTWTGAYCRSDWNRWRASCASSSRSPSARSVASSLSVRPAEPGRVDEPTGLEEDRRRVGCLPPGEREASGRSATEVLDRDRTRPPVTPHLHRVYGASHLDEVPDPVPIVLRLVDE